MLYVSCFRYIPWMVEISKSYFLVICHHFKRVFFLIVTNSFFLLLFLLKDFSFVAYFSVIFSTFISRTITVVSRLFFICDAIVDLSVSYWMEDNHCTKCQTNFVTKWYLFDFHSVTTDATTSITEVSRTLGNSLLKDSS